ncbi:MAG: hypothetical protein Ct9H300mP4_02500 [Gammaproteobacteria bacterium]|nr:MAG: hypothetical protein Ct9H300mP4_02500 [Gammaproteobacteria bacterium]
MIGTFFLTPEPGAEHFLKVAIKFPKGDTLCIIEAMKMMNQIESDVDGIVERILVQSGDPVEYPKALFLFKPKLTMLDKVVIANRGEMRSGFSEHVMNWV